VKLPDATTPLDAVKPELLGAPAPLATL